jgi:hypothetical protein
LIGRLFVMVFALVASGGPARAADVATSSQRLSEIKDAIDRKDAEAFLKIAPTIVYVTPSTDGSISVVAALEKIGGCRLQSSSPSSAASPAGVDLDYSCYARTGTMRCATGNLRLSVFDEETATKSRITKIYLVELPSLTRDCPLAAPLTPARVN